jgi:HD-GYP domain-containing protein (c-di-GMP phosphodiesterase class II)
MTNQREQLLSQFEDLKAKQRALFLATVDNLAQAVSLRDAYTGEHSRRVTRFALLLGQQLHLSAEDLEVLRYATPLHDLGKIGIEDGILRKPGPLTIDELEAMKTHTTRGARIVERVPALHRALAIVRSHHERWDGHGYPDGIADEDIPLLARIVAVAESFDAMTFDTPYRRRIPVEEAFAELDRQQGAQFDPTVVTAFLQIREQVVEEMSRLESKSSNGREVVS